MRSFAVCLYAVVRDERLRASFKTICWLNLSQQPEIMQLQARLYEQLSAGDEIPAKATKSVERIVEELRRVAKEKIVIVVLDGGYMLCVNTIACHSFSCV